MSCRHHFVIFTLLLLIIISCSVTVVNAQSFSKRIFSTNTTSSSTETSSYTINDILKIISYPSKISFPVSNSNITIAVIDTGINESVIPNFWTNSSGNYGYDFIKNKPVSFQSSSFSSHGTFIANILSTMTRNVSTINIMDIRVLDSNNNNPDLNTIVKAFEYALSVPSVKVIQFSIEFIDKIFTTYPPMLQWIFTKAYLRHIAIVTVSGNDEKQQISDPGNWSETIAVTSVDRLNNQWIKSIYANNGSNIDISAPGTDIQSVGANGEDLVFSGTSFSAAFVGGAVALLDAAYPSRNMSVETIRNLLQNSANKLNNCDQFGAGLLNVSNLLSLANGSSYSNYKAVCPGTYIIPSSLGPAPTSKSLDFSNFFISGFIMLIFIRKCKIRKLKRTLSFRNIIS